MRGVKWSLPLAMGIAAVMIFARLGELPLRNPDEGRGAEIAREMAASGAWLTPTFIGLECMDKPAFFFRTAAISFQLLGDSEASARLPSALFAVGILAMVFTFCRREYDEPTGILSIIVVATTPLFFALARHVLLDMTLAFFVCAAIFCGYLAETSESWKQQGWYLTAATAAGFATLVKGPVGFALPLMVLSAVNVLEKRTAWWKRALHPLNWLAFLAITMPWVIGLWRAHPDYLKYGLLDETLGRFTTDSFQRRGPFYYYGLVILGGFFAWSILLPVAISAAWKLRKKWTRADRFLITWAILVTVFFSFSKSKLPHYILTTFVALGILTARLFAQALRCREGFPATIVLRGIRLLAGICVIGASFLLINVFWPQVFHIKSREFDHVSLTFIPAAVLLGVVATFALAAIFRKDMRIAFATFLIIPLTLVTVGFNAVSRYSEASSSRQLAERILPLPPRTEILFLECFSTGLPFYLKKNIALATATGSELPSNYIKYRLKRAEVWPAHLVRLGQENEWLATRSSEVFVLADERSRPRLQKIVERYDSRAVSLGDGWWGALLPASDY